MTTWKTTYLSALFLAAAGCSGAAPGSMSVSSRLATPSGSASTAGPSAVSGNVTMSEIRIVVRRLELQDGDHGAKLPPFLMDLKGGDLTAGVHTVTEAKIAPGTYAGVEFDINTLSAEEVGGDAGLAAMQALHASIAVDGTATTTSASGATTTSDLHFTTPMELEQESECPFTVAPDGSSNLTFRVDPSGWFVDASGQPLDPVKDRGQIEANIRASIELFHDDNRDGVDDACEADGHGEDHASADGGAGAAADGGTAGGGATCSCPAGGLGAAPDGGMAPDGGAMPDGGTTPDGGTPVPPL